MRDWQAFVKSHLTLQDFEPAREQRIVRELAAQLEDFYRDALAHGTSEQQADELARRQIRDWDRLASDVRRADPAHTRPRLERWSDKTISIAQRKGGWWVMLSDLHNDLVFGLRMMRKNPGFSAVAVLTLALGIGANTAIFSFVDAVLIEPMPFDEPDRIVMIRGRSPVRNVDTFPLGVGDYADLRHETSLFEDFAALWLGTGALTGGDNAPEQVAIGRVTRDFFALLGVQPILGRSFVADDSDETIVISYELWQRRFGGAEAVLGQTVRLYERPYQIVGVLPPRLTFHIPNRTGAPTADTEIWRLMKLDDNPATADRTRVWLRVFGRLAPGVTLAQAQAEVDALAASWREAYASRARVDFHADVVSLKSQVVRDVQPTLIAFLGAAGFVLSSPAPTSPVC